MKKLLALLSVGVAVAMMTGCGLSPVGAPTIDIDPIGTIGQNSYATVTGKVEADTVISSITYTILTSTDASVPSNQIWVEGPTPLSDEEKIDFNDRPITIHVISAASSDYKLKISVTAGPSVDATFTFTVTGGGSGNVTEKTNISMGAQSAAPPSLLDADNMTTSSSTITDETRRGQIDVIFSYSTVLNPESLAFTSPDVAQGSPYDTWLTKAQAEYKLAPGGTTWASLTTQTAINTAWGSGSGAPRIPVSPGDIIIILTSAQVYKAVQIVSISGSDPTATMIINGKY
jgi:hypothetical protein